MNRKQIIGEYGEMLACRYLSQIKGYKIIKRNFRIARHEIDIIASFKEKLIFIEVKTSTSDYLGSAEDNFNQNQLKRLKKALFLYTEQFSCNPDLVQLDLVAVDINKFKKIARIKHYKNIF